MSMYKSVCLVVILLAAFAFTSGSRSADASPVSSISPPILAKAKLPNQTAAIPTTTLFTPTQDGLYRLTVYMTQVVTVPSSSANWNFNVNWSDDAGQEQAVSMVFLPVN